MVFSCSVLKMTFKSIFPLLSTKNKRNRKVCKEVRKTNDNKCLFLIIRLLTIKPRFLHAERLKI
ncbi:hypothetical protein A943_00335 [Bacillus sp. CPSM8]|nr:hypothetical protein A943_00335 [Bacillus sp. CPSM8]OMI09735.1 hypothetical protein BVL54_17135 [Bacillus paralicheniformis]POO80920.1 hypothetical protein C1T30_19400 [Bacillus sp. MBGLi97]